MANAALPAGRATPRRRALFGLFDADGWGWASVKAAFWFVFIILILGYIPDRAYYLTVNQTLELGLLAWSPSTCARPATRTSRARPRPAPSCPGTPHRPSSTCRRRGPTRRRAGGLEGRRRRRLRWPDRDRQRVHRGIHGRRQLRPVRRGSQPAGSAASPRRPPPRLVLPPRRSRRLRPADGPAWSTRRDVTWRLSEAAGPPAADVDGPWRVLVGGADGDALADRRLKPPSVTDKLTPWVKQPGPLPLPIEPNVGGVAEVWWADYVWGSCGSAATPTGR